MLDATIRVLSRVGFDGLTLRTVAEEAETAPATVYAYFDSREQLVSEILWQTMTGAQSRTSESAAAGGPASPLTLARVADTAHLIPRAATAHQLRERIHDTINERILAALGPDADSYSLELLRGIYVAALTDAGLGYASWDSGLQPAKPLTPIVPEDDPQAPRRH
ncbi:helix-turn-helix domain-containing protein [Nocardia tengchongensis]|uniref:helix-turn-helix domain-containing protein n=1 Tax=Nocardia tengchongensis TaxID=2055889 RepID=UPI00369A4B78